MKLPFPPGLPQPKTLNRHHFTNKSVKKTPNSIGALFPELFYLPKSRPCENSLPDFCTSALLKALKSNL